MSFLNHLYANMMANPYDTLWTAIGFGGQAVFGVRFLIQWWYSEKAGHSVIPLAFWYASIAGGVVLFAYAVHIQAWPLVLGQALPLPIYIRNLYMIYRDRRMAG
jgi:lipid-A-disaccharide synthase-like uncharacterized protein